MIDAGDASKSTDSAIAENGCESSERRHANPDVRVAGRHRPSGRARREYDSNDLSTSPHRARYLDILPCRPGGAKPAN
jgi:hypothetical protein